MKEKYFFAGRNNASDFKREDEMITLINWLINLIPAAVVWLWTADVIAVPPWFLVIFFIATVVLHFLALRWTPHTPGSDESVRKLMRVLTIIWFLVAVVMFFLAAFPHR